MTLKFFCMSDDITEVGTDIDTTMDENGNMDVIVSFESPPSVFMGELGKQLYREAGMELSEWDRLQNLSQGEVAAAPSLTQRAKYILYAVAYEPIYSSPMVHSEFMRIWPKIETGTELAMRKLYTEIMRLAEKLQCVSIVFPVRTTDWSLQGFYIMPLVHAAGDNQDYLDVDVVLFTDEAAANMASIEYGTYTDNIVAVMEERGLAFYDPDDLEDKDDCEYPDNQADEDMELCTLEDSAQKELGKYFPKVDMWDAAMDYFEIMVNEDGTLHPKKTWRECFLHYLDLERHDDKDICRRVNMDGKLLSKIRRKEDYHPSKSTVIALAVALRLSLSKTEDFLERAGYAFSPCDRSDLIVKWFIEHENYDMDMINEMLERFGMEDISIAKCRIWRK